MPGLSLSERVRIAKLAADRSRRRAVSQALSSPVLRWRYGASMADQLLIVPQNLRPADPSFWREIEMGQFGLSGSNVDLHGHSPFDVEPPSAAWGRNLHGFGWLHHLEAADCWPARDAARQLVIDWVARNRSGGSGVAALPVVAGRRLISWISHANLLLDAADPKTFDTVTSSLGLQLVRLSGSWRDVAEGYPRLLTLLALVLADLCIAGHDRQLAGAERAFSAELNRQILPDGGHVSRNPQVLVELLLDLLPLRQCFAARARPAPPALEECSDRMLRMLRFMRLGDGRLARFNGTGVASPAGLATVLAYSDTRKVLQRAPHSGYGRLERGETVVLVDAGRPPPLELAADAHAGCLSFEMSAGGRLLMVNGGAPGSANADWRSAARATASHNTLCLAEQSSSRLVRNRLLEDLIGGVPIRTPAVVEASVKETTDNGIELKAHHDGYLRRFGAIHRRRIKLHAEGSLVEGVDRIEHAPNSRLTSEPRPYAIHFHLHPGAICFHAEPGRAAEIVVGDDQQWRFSVDGATLSIEESIHYADSVGPRPSLQIVVRGTTTGDQEIRWQIKQRTS